MVTHESYTVVNRVLRDVGLHPKELSKGKVGLAAVPEKAVLDELNKRLLPLGYSIIDNNSEKIVLRIKAALLELLFNEEVPLKSNLSVYLREKIHYEYHYLSTVFSDFEKTSIEKYFIALRIAKAKELIIKGELTFSQIADQLGYSSPAHFANQFKQVVGKSPTEFKSTVSKK